MNLLRLLCLCALLCTNALASPFSFNGLCYATPNDALIAFKNLYPIVGETNYTYLVSSSVTTSGVLTYNLSTRPITADKVSGRNGTLSLTPCASPEAPFDYSHAGAIWAFFFSFTVSLWLVAKNAGLILNYVKNH